MLFYNQIKKFFLPDFLVNRADSFSPFNLAPWVVTIPIKHARFTRIIERPIRNFRRKIIGKRVFFHHGLERKKTEIPYYLGVIKEKEKALQYFNMVTLFKYFQIEAAQVCT